MGDSAALTINQVGDVALDLDIYAASLQMMELAKHFYSTIPIVNEMNTFNHINELVASNTKYDVVEFGDLDGDGVTDLAIGARGDDDYTSDTGAAYILFLNSEGTIKSAQKISNLYGALPYTLATNDDFGCSVASLGDLDRDGVGDLVVGAEGVGSSTGAVFVLFLTADGLAKSAQRISDSYGNLPYALDAFDAFGTSSASLGDIDEDCKPRSQPQRQDWRETRRKCTGCREVGGLQRNPGS